MAPVAAAGMPPILDSPWALAIGAFVLWMAVFLVARRVVLGMMRRVSVGTRWALADVFVHALSKPLLIAIVGGGLLIVGRTLPLSPRWDRAFDVTLDAAIVLAMILFVDRATRGLLDRLERESLVLKAARGLIQGAVRGVVLGIGLLIFLDSIGISITPLLASLGVGSLAVALALQDTLNNLFAGLYIVADKPIEAGDMVRIEGGEQGYIVKVGWRSTWLRTPANNIVVVPNVKLASSVLTNYNLVDSTMTIDVPAMVHYDSDLAKVERVTLDVAREVTRAVEGGVPEPEPAVRFQSFADSGITLATTLRCRRLEATALVRHEFLRRLHERYRKEGIVVPFPIRTLDLPKQQIAALSEALSPEREDRR